MNIGFAKYFASYECVIYFINPRVIKYKTASAVSDTMKLFPIFIL